MFLRTTSRKNTDGSTVTYYQLAHNERDPETGVPVARIIHNFGRADQVDREALVRLCRSIARICAVEVRDPMAESQASLSFADDVLVPGAVQGLTRPLGVPVVVEHFWDKLHVGPRLRDLERKSRTRIPLERALLLMVMNRICEPASKLGAWEEWRTKVHAPSFWDVKLDHLYEAMDFLYEHAEEVEREVFHATADLFNLDVDVVFFDTTTVSFMIDEADGEEEGALRVFGQPKKGGWAPQVVVALAVTREGVPVRSWLFPGNTNDVTTGERVKADLKGWKLGRAIFVADAGVNSEENRSVLSKGCGKYILAMRAGSVAEVKKEVLARAGRYKAVTENLHVKEVVVGDGERRRRYVVCYNPEQAKREALHRQEVLRELAERLAEHKDHGAEAKWVAELRASRRFGRYLTVDAQGRVVVDRKAVAEAPKLDGKWVVITNDDTLTTEDVATSYKALLVIERCFRTLKRTELMMQPVYHRLAARIEAHVKICVLALSLERSAELTAGRSWPHLRRALDELQATEYRLGGDRFFRRNEVSQTASTALRALKIQPPKQILDIQRA